MAKKIAKANSEVEFIENIDTANEEITRLTVEAAAANTARLQAEADLKAANEATQSLVDQKVAEVQAKFDADLKVANDAKVKAEQEAKEAKANVLKATAAAGVAAPAQAPSPKEQVDDSKVKTTPEATGLQRAINANIRLREQRA